MNSESVRAAARTARDLARLEEDQAFQPAAYAVLFHRLLTDDVPENRPRKGSASRPAPKRGGRRFSDAKVGPLQRLRDLTDDGFFKVPRSLKDTLEELRERGHTYDQAVAGKSLLRLVREKVLRRTRRKEGGREFYSYTEW